MHVQPYVFAKLFHDLPSQLRLCAAVVANPKHNPRRLRCGRSIHDVYWVVTDTNGTQWIFGKTPETSQYNGTVSNTHHWYLDKVIDPHGVFWTVSYDKDAVGGDMYPKQIVYSQQEAGLLDCTPTNLVACRTVNFFTDHRIDVSTSFASGGKIVSDQKLQRIEIRHGSGGLVKKYILSYRYRLSASRYKVQFKWLDEFGADGDAASPVTSNTFHFFYHVDSNQDSFGNLPSMIQTTMGGSPSEGVGGVKYPGLCVFTVDINGDHFDDVLVGDKDGGGWSWYKNFGTFGAGFTGKKPVPAGTPLPNLCKDVTTDVVTSSPGTATLTAPGEGSVTGGGYTHNQSTSSVVSGDVAVIDIDGDGLPDVVDGSVANAWVWWKNLGSVGSGVGSFSSRAALTSSPSVALGDQNKILVSGCPFVETYFGSDGQIHTRTVQAPIPHRSMRFADMDADGLVDAVQLDKVYQPDCDSGVGYTDWNVSWRRNMGGGRFSPTPTYLSVANGSDAHVAGWPDTRIRIGNVYPIGTGGYTLTEPRLLVLADMNEDGLPDIVWYASEGGSSYLTYLPNHGQLPIAGRNVIRFSAESSPYVYLSPSRPLVDVNGDGLPDLLRPIFHNGTPVYYTWHYFPNLGGDEFGDPRDLGYTSAGDLKRDKYLSLADMNGDGHLDILDGSPGSFSYRSLDMSDSYQQLEKAYNPLGGWVSFIYKKQHFFGTTPIRLVPSSMSISDGIHTFATSYSFNDFSAKSVGWPDNEFRGYASASQTDPAGFVITTVFHQDAARKGLIDNIQKAIPSEPGKTWFDGKVYSTATPDAVYSSGVMQVDLAAQINWTPTSVLGAYKISRTDYSNYDLFGNAHTVTTSGDFISTRVTSTDYAPPTSTNYIVNRPSRTDTRNDSATGTKISETWFDYDGQSNGLTPVKGDLTKKTHWLSIGAHPITQYAYDDVGNRIGSIDPMLNTCATTGYTSRVELDATYKTYPTKTTNALCHVTSMNYWGVDTGLSAASVTGAYAVPGLLARTSDTNGVASDIYYDVMGRERATVLPPNTPAEPTTLVDYVSAKIARKSRRKSVGGGVHVSYTFWDGLDRIIRSQKDAGGGLWVTQDTYYNNRGLVEAVSVPYYLRYVPPAPAAPGGGGTGMGGGGGPIGGGGGMGM